MVLHPKLCLDSMLRLPVLWIKFSVAHGFLICSKFKLKENNLSSSQASDGRNLLNASAMLDQTLDKNSFEATVMTGTQLCSRRLLQQIIYCVGGVSVFFPLIAQSDRYESEESGKFEEVLLTPITKERLTAEVIELIASVLDENLANQQQMLLLSGFSILGFLLQSVPPQQLNLETLSSLKHLFNVIANCGMYGERLHGFFIHVTSQFNWSKGCYCSVSMHVYINMKQLAIINLLCP